MAGCVLHAGGADFDAAIFLAGTTLRPYRVFRAGEEILPGAKAARRFDEDGFKVEVSDADGLPAQIEEAIAFLRAHQGDLQKLAGQMGVKAVLDFGISRQDPGAFPAQYDSLPADLLSLSGGLGLSICLSHYF